MSSKDLIETLERVAPQRSSGWWFLRRVAGRFRHLWLCAEVRRERSALLKLSDHELRDMGIDRVDARREANRAYFDIPANRRGEKRRADDRQMY